MRRVARYSKPSLQYSKGIYGVDEAQHKNFYRTLQMYLFTKDVLIGCCPASVMEFFARIGKG